MKKSKKQFILITGNKTECFKYFPNTYLVHPVMTYRAKKNKPEDQPMSGVVILMMAAIRDNGNESLWTNHAASMASTCKKNSLDSYSHHGTSGFTYSFGNRPFYGQKDGISVSCYTTIPSKKSNRDLLIKRDARYLEYKCAMALDYGISKVRKIIPEIKHLLCPIINAAFHKQSKEGIDMIQSRYASDNGCWNSFLFVDGKTDNFHRENDCAYTFITVPKQNLTKGKHILEQTHFLFQINEDKKLSLPLIDDITFLYNASFLTHRQSYFHNQNDNHFYNISSYANDKLFNHLRKSFDRLNKK